MARAKPRRCVDCAKAGRPLTRPAPHPGPRCATDWRAKKSERRTTAQEKRLLDTYALDLDEYEAIKAHQGGKCAICQRATGAKRALAVDHDHATGYNRGLLCKPCNVMLGRARDDTEFFRRAIEYLTNPPAFAVIGKRIAPIELPNLTHNVTEEAA